MQNNLNRFLEAHHKHYTTALEEIKQGYKKTHWMWFIFPQYKGLGFSHNTQFYAIQDIDEAKKYLKNPILKQHLCEILSELLKHNKYKIEDILGEVDALKLCSCLTLFDYIAPNDIFIKTINTFYNTNKDEKTIKLIHNNK